MIWRFMLQLQMFWGLRSGLLFVNKKKQKTLICWGMGGGGIKPMA
jgi:hypothetical protein